MFRHVGFSPVQFSDESETDSVFRSLRQSTWIHIDKEYTRNFIRFYLKKCRCGLRMTTSGPTHTKFAKSKLTLTEWGTGKQNWNNVICPSKSVYIVANVFILIPTYSSRQPWTTELMGWSTPNYCFNDRRVLNLWNLKA